MKSPWAQIEGTQPAKVKQDKAPVFAPIEQDQHMPTLPEAPVAPRALYTPADTGDAPIMPQRVNFGTSRPPVFAPSSQPDVQLTSDPLQQIEGNLQNRLQANYRKDIPWAQRSTPSKIGHIFSTLGNVAGNIFAPQTMALIPGTQLHNQFERRGLENELQGVQSQEAENAFRGTQASNIQSEQKAREQAQPGEEALREAQIKHLGAETQSLENKGPKFSIHDTESGPLFVNEETGTAQHITVDGHPVGAKMKLTQSQPIMGADGKPHTYMIDDHGNKVVDLGVHYERPVSVNVGAGGALGEKAWEYANNQLNALGKPVSELSLRMGRLKDTLAQASPQADALIAPELLTVMAGGQGSGLRMNEAEISRIVGGRSHWENLKGSVQKWATDPTAARSITPDQDKQIRSLIQVVDQKLQAKQGIINDAANQMVTTTNPMDHRKILADTRQKMQQVDNGNNITQGQEPPPAIGTIKKGHRYLGGNPSSPSSWERVNK